MGQELIKKSNHATSSSLNTVTKKKQEHVSFVLLHKKKILRIRMSPRVLFTCCSFFGQIRGCGAYKTVAYKKKRVHPFTEGKWQGKRIYIYYEIYGRMKD